jgi:POT family proton-dependent oligopeptide transporter
MEQKFRKTHPRALYTLFGTEMWERFSYYGMRALLTLYLTAKLIDDGFGLPREQALEIYALFTGLVYLTPILGGWISDKFLGQRKTVYIGGIVMAIGQFLLAASAFLAEQLDHDTRLFLFNFGLGVLIIGNGFFKPNISTVVGDFYDDNDPMKDAAFNIFYLGINLGAILGTFIAGGLGENVNWGYGFLAAGIGMLLSVLWLKWKEDTLEREGLPPNSPPDKLVLDAKDWKDIFIYAIGLVLATLTVIAIWRMLPDSVTTVIAIGGLILIFLVLFYIILKGTNGKDEWSRMAVIITLAIFNIVFWAGFEQAGGTFSLFARDNTDRKVEGFALPVIGNIDIKFWGILALISLFVWIYTIYIKIYSDDTSKLAMAKKLGKYSGIATLIFGFLAILKFMSEGPEIPATWFQNVNSFAILIFAPLFSIMWLKLDKLHLNPRTPIKFALGLFLGAVAFFVMTQAQHLADTGIKVSPWWLVSVYVLLTLGELMLSPIGLSMITKLAPTKLVSVVMGLWMASFAAGNYMAGMLEGILKGLNEKGYHIELYPFIMWVMLGTGLAIVLLSPLLNKAMKGIH